MKTTRSNTPHAEVHKSKRLASRFEAAFRRIHFLPAIFLCVFFHTAAAFAQEALWKTYKDAGEIASVEAGKNSDKNERKERYAEAEKRLVLAGKEAEAFGPQDWRLATTLQTLISVYLQQDKFAEAAPLSKRVAAILAETARTDPMKSATASFEIGNLYYNKSKYAESEPFYKQAVTIVERIEGLESTRKEAKALGSEELQLATTLHKLIAAYLQQQKYVEAEPLAKKIIGIWEQSPGPNPMKTANSAAEIANLYYNGDKYAQSESFYEMIIAMVEKSPPTTPERRYIPNLRYALAGAYNNQRKYGDAESVLKVALEIEEKTGKDEALISRILYRLGIAYAGLRQYKNAETSYRRAISIVERLPLTTAERRFLPELQCELADACIAQGNFVDAESVLVPALAMTEKDRGKDYLQVGRILYRLGVTYQALLKYDDAEKSYQRSVAVFRKNSRDAWAWSTLGELGNLHRSRGEYYLAEPIFKGLVSELENDKKTDELTVAEYILNLGLVYQAQEKYADAQQVFERLRAIYEQRKLKPEDPRQVTIRNNIAKAYYLQGRYAEAEPLYLEAIELAKKAGSEDAAWYEKNYALLLFARGDKDRADTLFQKALLDLSKDKNDGERQMAASWFELAELYRAQEKYSEAAPLFKQALEGRLKVMKPDHLDLAVTMEKYAATLRKLGRQAEAEALEEQARVIRSKHAPQH